MWFGIVMGLLASASWAAANVFIQRAGRAVGPFRALVWAQIAGAVAVAPFAWLLDQRAGAVDAGLAGWIALALTSAVLAYASMFYAFERGRLSIVVPVMSSWSVIAAAISIGVLHESVRRAQLAGGGLVAAGVFLVSRFAQSERAGRATDDDSRRTRWVLLASVGAALGFGVLIPAIDRLAPVFGRLGAIPLVFLGDLLLGLPLAAAARIDLRPPPRSAWPVILLAGLFETAGFIWISIGVARAPVAIVSPFAGLASAFTVLFAWVALGERPSPRLLAGAALVCAGVVVLAL
jgi:drug/metabolite transporter (DMT)-like permease